MHWCKASGFIGLLFDFTGKSLFVFKKQRSTASAGLKWGNISWSPKKIRLDCLNVLLELLNKLKAQLIVLLDINFQVNV